MRIDADRDDHRDRDDPAVATHFDIGGVGPDIGPVAFERAIQEGLHAFVDFNAMGEL